MTYLKNVTTINYHPEKCVGCGRCIEVCPHAVFSMQDKRAVLGDKDKCMECGACEKNCSYNAIRVHAGVGCAYAVATGTGRGSNKNYEYSKASPENQSSTSCCA